jgi:hypothetical protein
MTECGDANAVAAIDTLRLQVGLRPVTTTTGGRKVLFLKARL